jgi:hypothetical protein
MVADGVLVALSAARQAIKNHVIVRALRDRADYDRELLLAASALELGLLAAENDADAARVSQQIDTARGRMGVARHPSDFRTGDRRQLKRRRKVLVDVAEKLREVAADENQVGMLLDAARDLALAEVQAATAAAHGGRRNVTPEDRAAALSELRVQLDDLIHENTGY